MTDKNIDQEQQNQEEENQEENQEKHSIAKTITIISYGYSNKTPKIYPDSITFDVRDFSEVDNEISDENNGTSAEYQDAFTKTESNQILYDNIFNELKEKLLPALDSSDEEIIKVFVGGEYGVHRSVAIVEMLARDLKTCLDSMKIENISEKSIDIDTEHRDIDLHKEEEEEKSHWRKNKKLLGQDRSRRRDMKSKNRYG